MSQPQYTAEDFAGMTDEDIAEELREWARARKSLTRNRQARGKEPLEVSLLFEAALRLGQHKVKDAGLRRAQVDYCGGIHGSKKRRKQHDHTSRNLRHLAQRPRRCLWVGTGGLHSVGPDPAVRQVTSRRGVADQCQDWGRDFAPALGLTGFVRVPKFGNLMSHTAEV